MNTANIMKRKLTGLTRQYRAALGKQTNVQLGQLKRTLRQRSVDLAASNRQLKQEIARRKLAECGERTSPVGRGYVFSVRPALGL